MIGQSKANKHTEEVNSKTQELIFMVREKSTEMILVRSLAFTQRQDGKLLDWENICFYILWECGKYKSS